MPWPWPRNWTQDLGNGAYHSVPLQHTPELSLSRSVNTLNGEFTVKHLDFNYYFFPPIGLVILVISSLSLNFMFLLSPPNTLVPPHCLCPVRHNPLLWIVNMALTHSREKRGGTKSRWRGKKNRQCEGEMKIERESTARDRNMRGDSEAGKKNVRDNFTKRKRGILNHHQQGKYCFEIGHATMQRLLAPNSFCRTLQKWKRLCVYVCIVCLSLYFSLLVVKS